MTARAKYLIGTTILFIAIVLILISILGMSGVTPKYFPPRETNLTAMVLVVLAGGLRRRARKEMAAANPPHSVG